MRSYEMMFILKPDLSEEVVTETNDRLQTIIAEFGGEFTNQQMDGKEYPGFYSIQDYLEGVYFLCVFQRHSGYCSELDRVIKYPINFYVTYYFVRMKIAELGVETS